VYVCVCVFVGRGRVVCVCVCVDREGGLYVCVSVLGSH
jgi:hypothetical protein